MKSQNFATFLLTVLTSLLVGGIGGWLGRGMFSERPAAEAATGFASVNHSSPSAAPTNPSEAQRLRSAHVAQSNLTAKQLLQQVMDKSVPPGKEELFLARFRTAVISCDEAAVAEMAAMLVAFVKPSEDPFAGQYPRLVDCTLYLVRRMLALNPPKALGALLSLVKAGMSEMEENAIEVLDVLSESELSQAEELMKPWLGTNSFETMEFALMQARMKFDVEGVFQDLMHKEVPTSIEGDLEGVTIQNVISRLAQESPEKAMQVLARFQIRGFNFFQYPFQLMG